MAGGGVPGTLLLPLGLAGIVVASQLTTYFDWSAELTTPLVVVLAIGGVILGRDRIRTLRPDIWAAAAALGVFATFAAPVVASGEATFAGYSVLGDTSIHFIGADHLLEHGRNLKSLEPSSYEFSLAQYYGNSGYPAGGPTAIGAVRPSCCRRRGLDLPAVPRLCSSQRWPSRFTRCSRRSWARPYFAA